MGESGSGHAIVLDGSPEIGGRDLGIRPMEMILIGLGGCTCMDVLSILKKQRQNITDCVIEIAGERATDDPKVFTEIRLHFIVSGRQLKSSHVQRAVDLSAEKYCSVSAMLGKTARIIHDFEIIEEN
jgi:putative redox protein